MTKICMEGFVILNVKKAMSLLVVVCAEKFNLNNILRYVYSDAYCSIALIEN